MAIDVKETGADDFLGRDGSRVDAKAIVAAPEHGALSGAAVDQDVGALIRAVRADFEIVEVNAAREEAVHLNAAALVVADGADVLGAEPEPRTSDQRAGYLSAWAEDLAFERYFAAISGKMRDDDERIGGVQAYAHHVECRHKLTGYSVSAGPG